MYITATRASFQRRKNSSRGFTLTEIAIVLGIVGLLIGAVWKGASSVYSNSASVNFQQQIGTYVASVRSACSNGTCTTALPTSGIPAVPTVAGVTTPVAAVTSTGTGWTLIWSNVPTNSNAGLNFCNNLTSVVSTMGGQTGETVAIATAGAKTKANTCGGSNNTTFTDAANDTGYTVVPSANGTCTGGNPSPATDVENPTNACGATTTAAAYFNYSF